MSTLGCTRLRLAADTASFDAPLDVLRRATPQMWRGNDVQFEIAVFFNGVLQDVSSLASLTLEIRPLGANGGPPDPSFTPLMGATVSSFDNTTTIDDWNSGTKQQAVVAFTAAQSNIAAGSAWLSIFAITNDSPGRVVTLCAGPIRLLEDGAGLATTPTPAADTFYTAAQSDARFAALGAGGEGGALASDDSPLMDGTVEAGTSTSYSRADHVHPTDTSRASATHASQHGSGGSDPVTIAQSQVTGLSSALAALAPLASPALTGTPTAPTVGTATDSTTKIATTAFVQAAITAAGGGGGTWGGITGTLSDQSDLNTALAAKAPLASPTLTGTVTIPTVSGTSDSSTKAASTAFVQAVLATIPTLPAISSGTAGKLLSNDGSAISWASPGFTVDGSGNIIFNGSTALAVQDGTGVNNAEMSVYGALATESTTGLHKLIYNSANNLDVLLIQKNGASGGHSTGQSAIDFMSSTDYDDSSVANAIMGAVGFSNNVSDVVGGGMYLSFSPPFTQASDFAQPTSGVGEFHLNQEGIIRGTDYRRRDALKVNKYWSMELHDPDSNLCGYFSSPVSGNDFYDYGSMSLYLIGSDDYKQSINPGVNGGASATLGIKSSSGNMAIFCAYPSSMNYHAYPATGAALASYGSGGLVLMAADSSGVIKFLTAGDSSTNERLKIDSAGNFVASNVVTSDLSATLANSQYQFTVYDNSGTAVFKIRYKDASGTVKTGSVALA